MGVDCGHQRNGRCIVNDHPVKDPSGFGTAKLPMSLIISEVELLLAEKRTALSVTRTAIAVFAVPLSVFSILIATSGMYTLSKVMVWIIPVALMNFSLISLGIYLMVRSLRKIRDLDERIIALKKMAREIVESGIDYERSQATI